MTIVRTVLGEIPASELGVCYAHEHIIIDPSYTTELFPDFLLNSVENAAQELAEFYAAGGRAMIDSMPSDSGRNVLKLAEVSRRTGVHIVCPTGLHLQKYYPHGHWGTRLSVEQLAELFIADIERGIDANDYGGPAVERTPHRAGVIKVAGGLNQLEEHERKIFRAAALAHRATGVSILTHTEQGTAALEQVKVLTASGVRPDSIVLSHTDRQTSLAYHKEILATGVFVEYDSAFRWKPEQGNPTRDLIVSLFAEGFGNQIMLGMDAARRGYWKAYGGTPGLTYLLTTFNEQLLEAGQRDSDIHQIFVANPARAYALKTQASGSPQTT